MFREELGVPGAYVGEVRVARGVGDDVATPAPAVALVFEHREEQQVLGLTPGQTVYASFKATGTRVVSVG